MSVVPYDADSQAPTQFFLRKGWRRALELGVQDQFVKGAETEEDWIKAMEKLDRWESDMDEKVQHREITYQTPPAHLQAE